MKLSAAIFLVCIMLFVQSSDALDVQNDQLQQKCSQLQALKLVAAKVVDIGADLGAEYLAPDV